MFFKTALGWALGLGLPLAAYGAAAEKGPLRFDDVLQAWKASTDALRSWDVYLRVEYVYVMKAVIVGRRPRKVKGPRGVKIPGEPIIEMRDRPAGEPPERRVQFSRQVLSQEGKRRYELRPPGSDNWIEAKVFDGEIVRSRSAGKVPMARIDGRGPDVKDFVAVNSNYAALYDDTPYGGPMIKVLRSRKGTRLVEGARGKAHYVQIESPPEEGFYCPTCGWRIAVDPAHGMMPVEIEFFRDTMKVPVRRITIQEFHEVEPGVWAPVKATHACLSKGRLVTRVNLVVDMARSRWNQPVAEELFTLAIPEGTRVVDDTRNIAFVAGEGDTGKNLDRLVENARNVVRVHPPKPLGPPRTHARLRLFLLFGLNAVVIALVLGIVYVRLRKRRAVRSA